jgi:metallo-beta-lactamase class B
MMPFRALAFLALTPLAVLAQGSRLVPDQPINCDQCPAWNAPLGPFRVFGNTYYVGTAKLSAILITSDAGLILLDGALPQSVTHIDANIRMLGFKTKDVRLIVNSHVHFDHAGGIAALQRATGATVAASAKNARALEQGGPLPDDPQSVPGFRLPSVKKVRVVRDGETLRVGPFALTAHLTPGHTPGATTWTWQSCEDSRCLDIVYADSLNPVSAPGFRFTRDARHPSIVDSFRQSIALVERLPCDILLSVHPEFSDMDRKLAGRARGETPDPFVDHQGCRAYAAAAGKALDQRIASERQVVK